METTNRGGIATQASHYLPDVPFGQRFMRAVEDASPYRFVRRRDLA